MKSFTFKPLASQAVDEDGHEDDESYDETSIYTTIQKRCALYCIAFQPYVPMFYVFLSGLGFSIQTLFVKLLFDTGFHGSFQLVLARGVIQLVLASFFIHRNAKAASISEDSSNSVTQTKLCGPSRKVAMLLTMRSVIGYGGIAFAFLSVERLPIGDSTVLVMLAPLFSAIGGLVFLGEPYMIPEMVGTFVSLVGAVLVARPSFLFHSTDRSEPSPDSLGVIYALFGSVASGGAYVLVRILGTTAKMPWANVCWAQSWGQILLSPPFQIIAGQPFRLDLSVYQFTLIFLGGFIGAWSQVAMTVGMQREKSATATAMRMSDIIFGYIWQVMFTDDTANWLSILGAFLITFSVLIIVAYKKTDTVKTPLPLIAVTEAAVAITSNGTSRKVAALTANAGNSTSDHDEDESARMIGDSEIELTVRSSLHDHSVAIGMKDIDIDA